MQLYTYDCSINQIDMHTPTTQRDPQGLFFNQHLVNDGGIIRKKERKKKRKKLEIKNCFGENRTWRTAHISRCRTFTNLRFYWPRRCRRSRHNCSKQRVRSSRFTM